MTSNSDREDGSTVKADASRRAFLRAAGTGIATVSLAGCVSSTDDGGSGSGGGGNNGSGGSGGGGGNGSGANGSTNASDSGSGGGDIGTVDYGILNPLTGPYGALAEEQRNGAELGVQYVNDSDEFDFTIEATYDDSEANPEAGRRKAQRLVDNGAGYLMGAISSSVALALNDFAGSQEVIYNPGAAAIPITGSGCNEYVFRAETNTAQIAAATSGWTAENLGKNVWFHIADYAYDESVLSEMRTRMESTQGFSVVGTSRSELGATNFCSYISQNQRFGRGGCDTRDDRRRPRELRQAGRRSGAQGGGEPHEPDDDLPSSSRGAGRRGHWDLGRRAVRLDARDGRQPGVR